MKKASQLYAVFNSRTAIESVIDVLREEGFRSPDLQVMVGLPEEVTPGSAERANLHANRWFAGVPASHFDSDLYGIAHRSTTHFSNTSNLEPALYEYLSRGGLLLEITIRNSSERAAALEVLEDLGVTWFEDPSSGAAVYYYRESCISSNQGPSHLV